MQRENERSCYKKSLSSPHVWRPAGFGDLQRTRRFVMKQQTTCVEDSRLRPSGMTGLFYHGNNAFTLIELLVVVLIIGILAAVALPQYQLAVDKSRIAPYLQVVRDILKAEELYFATNGVYTSDLQLLDIDVSQTCPVQFGGEMRNCTGGFAFNIPSQYNVISAPRVSLYYCQSAEICDYNQNQHLVSVFPFNGGTPACASYSFRGKKLCEWIKSRY